MLLPLVPPPDMTEKLKISYQFTINALSFLQTNGYTNRQFDQFVLQHLQHPLQLCSLLQNEPDWIKQHLLDFEQKFPNTAQRDAMLRLWKQDVRFYQRRKQPHFELQFITEGLPRPDKKTMKTYFADFYETFFALASSQGGNFRYLFREEYAKENEVYRHVCPACLGHLDIHRAQLDHYFPVHYFPSLTIHPYNLIPICPSCNTAIGSTETKGKGGNIPGDKPKPDMLRELLLPYQSNGFRKIRVEFTGAAGRRKARLTAIKKAKPLLVKQVENHAKLYNLDREWSRRLPYLYERLVVQMQKHFRLIKSNQVRTNITLFEIRSYLRDFIIRGSESQLFRVSDEFLHVSFVVWLYKNQGPLKALRDDLNKRLQHVKNQRTQQLPYIWHEYEEA